MTKPSGPGLSNNELDAELARLAQVQKEQRAPAALRESIRRNVHHAMREAALAPASTSHLQQTLQRTLRWVSAHWWRMAYMGSTAAAIPLLTGALLGYQLTSTERMLADPASEWLTSYSSEIDNSPANAFQEALP